jgi:tetratricopeptide (TPR) repeat protein
MKKPILRKALRVLQGRKGGNAVEQTYALNDLAILKQKTGKLLEADGLYKRSIGILETAVSRDDLDLIVTRKNRAVVLSELGRLREADLLYRQCLDSFERVFGPDSPRVAIVLKQYAVLLRNMHRNAEAKQMEVRCARISSSTSASRNSEMTIDIKALEAESRAHSR